MVKFLIIWLITLLYGSSIYIFDVVNLNQRFERSNYLTIFVCRVNSLGNVSFLLSAVRKNSRTVNWNNLTTREKAFLESEMLSHCRRRFKSLIGAPFRSILSQLTLNASQQTCSQATLNSQSLGFLRTILRGNYSCSEGGVLTLFEGANQRLCLQGENLRRVCTVSFPALGNFRFNVPNGNVETPTPTPTLISHFSRYSGQFDKQAAAILLSKIGLGATRPQLEQGVQMGLDGFVNKLVDDCNISLQTSRFRQLEPIAQRIRKNLKQPHWSFRNDLFYFEKPNLSGNFDGYERDTLDSLNNYLYFHFLNGSPLCGSIWVILHNWFALQHGALEINAYPALTGDYVDLIIRHLVGSFEDLVKGMHSNAHMLVWLDNHLNRVKCAANGNILTGTNCFTANQNYAREVMELFTFGTNDIFRPRGDGGIDFGAINYTELDVENLTRAAVGPERIFLSSDFPEAGVYPGPKKKNHNITPFCTYRRINITAGSSNFTDNYPIDKYSTNCIPVTGLAENRFGFNHSNWAFGESHREYDPLNREFFRGIYLFANTPWSIGTPTSRQHLNLNTFKCRDHSSPNSNETPCQFYFSHNRITDTPRNVAFVTGSSVVTDNITDRLLYLHGYFPGKGSSAARKLAIQLLAYFIGHNAARTPSLVYELAEILVQNRFNLGETLKILLKSQLVFNQEYQKTTFKTPFEWSLMVARTLRIPQMYYHTHGAHTYFTTIRWIDELSRQTGFPNLNLPSVFGVAVAGIQRNTMIADGRAFVGPVQYLVRARLLNLMQRYIFLHYTRGSALQMSSNTSDSLLGTYSVDEGLQNVQVYRPLPDPWGWNGAWNPDIRYLIYAHQYPQFFGFETQESQSRYSPYSGQIFNWLDYLREYQVLDATNRSQVSAEEIINELSLRWGVTLTQGQKEELLNFFTKLQPQDSSSCWGSLREITAQDGLSQGSMSRQEAENRYFNLKFWGLVFALALNSADSWAK